MYLEWLGQKSILADPRVEYGIATGKYTAKQIAILRRASEDRVQRVLERSERYILKEQIDGLSRSYQWGPTAASMIQVVADGDARLILASASGSEFTEIVGGEQANPIIIPDRNLYIMNAHEYKSNKEFYDAMKW